MPMAVFQSLGQIELYQVSELFPENVHGPGMESRRLARVLEHFSKTFRGLLQPSKALGKLNSTRSRNSSQKNVSRSWDGVGVSKPLGTCLGPGTMLARVPRPMAAFQGIEKNE